MDMTGWSVVPSINLQPTASINIANPLSHINSFISEKQWQQQIYLQKQPCFLMLSIGYYKQQYNIINNNRNIIMNDLNFLSHKSSKQTIQHLSQQLGELRLHPQSKQQIYVSKARKYQLQGQLNLAMMWYQKAMAASPQKKSHYQNYISQMYARRRPTKQVMQELKKILQVKPNSQQIYLKLAKLYIQVHHQKEAMEFADRAIEINGRSVQAYYLKAEALTNSLQFRSAEECCNTAIELDPNHVASLNLMGILACATHRSPAISIEYFKRVVQLQPDNFKYEINLGVAKVIATGLLPEVNRYDNYVRLGYKIGFFYYGELGDLMVQCNLIKEAIKIFEQAVDHVVWIFEDLQELKNAK